MTTIQKKAVLGQANPIAHLTEADIEQIGIELDAIRQDVIDSRGASDAAYIRRVIDTQRKIELGSRAVLLFSAFPPAWVLGTLGLSISKILDNMEIGHNILHGQWDWMRDPKIHSTTWEWDIARRPRAQWKHTHNELHHTLHQRPGQGQRPRLRHHARGRGSAVEARHLAQPLFNASSNAVLFEYGIAAYDLELGASDLRKTGKSKDSPRAAPASGRPLRKLRKQVTKDYVVLLPLLTMLTGLRQAPSFGHRTANAWCATCGPTPSSCAGTSPRGVETFAGGPGGRRDPRRLVRAPDARLRQHLRFPVPAPDDRQPVAPDRAPPLPGPAVQPLRRDRAQGAGPLRQVRPHLLRAADGPAGRLAWHKVIRLSLPNGWLTTTNAKNAPQQLAVLYKMATGDRRTRRLLGRKLESEARAAAA